MNTGSVDVIALRGHLPTPPTFPNSGEQERHAEIHWPPVKWKNKTFAALAVMAVAKTQIHRLASGKPPKANANPALSLHQRPHKTTRPNQTLPKMVRGTEYLILGMLLWRAEGDVRKHLSRLT